MASVLCQIAHRVPHRSRIRDVLREGPRIGAWVQNQVVRFVASFQCRPFELVQKASAAEQLARNISRRGMDSSRYTPRGPRTKGGLSGGAVHGGGEVQGEHRLV